MTSVAALLVLALAACAARPGGSSTVYGPLVPGPAHPVARSHGKTSASRPFDIESQALRERLDAIKRDLQELRDGRDRTEEHSF